MKSFVQEIEDALGGEFRSGSPPVDKLDEGDESIGDLNSVGQSLFRLMSETNRRFNECVSGIVIVTHGGAIVTISSTLEEMKMVLQLQLEAQIASNLLKHHLMVEFRSKVQIDSAIFIREGWKVVSQLAYLPPLREVTVIGGFLFYQLSIIICL